MLTQEQLCAVRKHVISRASKLKGNAVFRNEDVEDLRQELWVRVLAALEKFDPKRGDFEHFVSKVLKNQAGKMIHKQVALKRAPFAVQLPLNEEIAAHPETEGEEASLARLELDRLLQRLPRAVRQIVERLPEHSCREIARQSGVSRPSIRKVVAALRPTLAAHLGGPDFLGVFRVFWRKRRELCACL